MMTLTVVLSNEEARDLLAIEKDVKKELLRGMTAEATKPEVTRQYVLVTKLCTPVRAHLSRLPAERR